MPIKFVRAIFALMLFALFSFALPRPAQAIDVCEKPVEVVLLLDYSGSVAAVQSSIIKFASDLVSRFILSPDVARFGVVRYATVAVTLTGLSTSEIEVQNAVSSALDIGFTTNIEDGFANALAVMRDARPGIPRIIVHLTDGMWNTGGDPIFVAQVINASGIHIFGVDYGQNVGLVTQISNKLFPTGGLGVDQLTGIINALAGAICNATIDVPPLGTVGDSPDNRANTGVGDVHAVIYGASDQDGNPAVHIYCVDDNSNGYFAFEVTVDDLKPYPDQPATYIEIKRTDSCRVPVAFYLLTSGEYQVNIGPDQDGKVFEIIFTGLIPQNMQYREFNIYNP